MTDYEIPSCSGSGGKPEETRKAMRDMLGPQAVDWFIRHAISTCWMMLPDNKKNVTQVEAEIRHEPSDSDSYPHIYGPLKLTAVTAVLHLEPGSDGRFSAPPGLVPERRANRQSTVG